jgi:apolipoprotein D and lipocalin family protein
MLKLLHRQRLNSAPHKRHGLPLILLILRKYVAYAILLLPTLVAPLAQADESVQSVAHVDLNRYAGKWHEIALFPNRFQAMCVRDTTAEYALQPDGRIQVTNRCKNADGKIEEAIGTAKKADGNSSNAQLKVRFAPWWLSFLPQVWGDYWVIELDPEYRYSVVSEPSRKFLWILARTPTMDDAVYAGIVSRLQTKGYDTSRLVRAM